MLKPPSDDEIEREAFKFLVQRFKEIPKATEFLPNVPNSCLSFVDFRMKQ